MRLTVGACLIVLVLFAAGCGGGSGSSDSGSIVGVWKESSIVDASGRRASCPGTLTTGSHIIMSCGDIATLTISRKTASVYTFETKTVDGYTFVKDYTIAENRFVESIPVAALPAYDVTYEITSSGSEMTIRQVSSTSADTAQVAESNNTKTIYKQAAP